MEDIMIPIEHYNRGPNLITEKLHVRKDGNEIPNTAYLHPSIYYLIFYFQFFVED